MKKLKTNLEGINFSVLEIGNLTNLSEYSYFHPLLKTEIPGKLFVGELLKTTGVEISFQEIAPKTEIPFYHKHKKQEEIYFIIKGSGQFQVDDTIFDIQEGSLIRVAPEGKRTWRNNSESPMIYMVIQASCNSLDKHYVDDGYGIREKVSWV